jgi:hypothetical protein
VRVRPIVLLLAAVVSSAAAATADDLKHPPIHPFGLTEGDKIRIWTSGPQESLAAETAIITATDHTGMMVVVRDQARLLPFESITRLEVRRGRSWARRGALLGLGLGALAGSWLFADELADGAADAGDRVRQGLLLGAAGAVVGGVSGGALHPARWESVSIESVRPRPAGAPGPSVSFRF